MAIVYEKSELGTFLEQLPTLLSQYQQAINKESREDELIEKRFNQEVQLMEMKNEQAEALNTQKLLIDEYGAKKMELQNTLKLFDDFPGLKPEEMTEGAPKLTNDYLKGGKIDLEMLSENISNIGSHINKLEDAKTELDTQVQDFTKLVPEYSGLNTVLQAQEFADLKEHAVNELGYQPEAMDYAYGQMGTPTQIKESAFKMTDYLKKEHTVAGDSNYALLQGAVKVEEDGTIEDVMKKLSYEDADGNPVKPSEKIVSKVVEFLGQSNHKEFMQNLHAYKGESGELLREFFTTNPKFRIPYMNLKDSYRNEIALEREMLDITGQKSDIDISSFSENISGMSKDTMFGYYKDIISKVPLDEHQQYFTAMEQAVGSDDLYPEFKEWSGLDLDDDSAPEGSLAELAGLTKELEILNNLEESQKTSANEYVDNFMTFSRKWGTKGGTTQLNDLGKIISSVIGDVDPSSTSRTRTGREVILRPEYFDRSDLSNIDFTPEEMNYMREEVRGLASQWISTRERGGLNYVYDKWTGAKNRGEGLSMLADWVRFEKALASYQGAKELPVDSSKAILELEAILKQK
tara:strand:- start:12654 stop:14381 length:1728 start_codon:yes stop_codon:yes gene_type:complete